MIRLDTTPPDPNWTETCHTCGAVMVARTPTDLVAAKTRHGWTVQACRAHKASA